MAKLYLGSELVIDPDKKLESIELTLAEYDALTEVRPNVLYLITDAENPLDEAYTKIDNSFVNASYDQTTKLLIFYSTDGTETRIDATPFIVDNFVDSVTVSNGNLVITFNSEDKEPISIPISVIFDSNEYYTKEEIDNKIPTDYISKNGLEEVSSSYLVIPLKKTALDDVGVVLSHYENTFTNNTKNTSNNICYTEVVLTSDNHNLLKTNMNVYGGNRALEGDSNNVVLEKGLKKALDTVTIAENTLRNSGEWLGAVDGEIPEGWSTENANISYILVDTNGVVLRMGIKKEDTEVESAYITIPVKSSTNKLTFEMHYQGVAPTENTTIQYELLNNSNTVLDTVSIPNSLTNKTFTREIASGGTKVRIKLTGTSTDVLIYVTDFAVYEGDILPGSWKRFPNETFRVYNKAELDDVSYGVYWKKNVADPHLTRVGNMTYHKTLPIQNAMKGCIYDCLTKLVVYYLDPNDWRFKANNSNDTLTVTLIGRDDTNKEDEYEHTVPVYICSTETPITITADLKGKYLRYTDETTGTHILQIMGDVGSTLEFLKIISEETTLSVSNTSESVYSFEKGSRRDGYDGEVMVEVPEFWIKSWDNTLDSEVRISPTYVDATWEHQPKVYLGAYRSSVLQSIPPNDTSWENSYLAKLPDNSAVSVANDATWMRGGKNENSNYDISIKNTYSEVNSLFKTHLNKPRTYLTRSAMRTYSNKAGKYVMSYNDYKNIFYWLWVIEYANFNSLEQYIEALTTDGYRQGGLGIGISNLLQDTSVLPYWNDYNGINPLTPNGYLDYLGNRTGIKKINNTKISIGKIDDNTFTDHSLAFSKINTNVGGIVDSVAGIATLTKVITGINLHANYVHECGTNTIQVTGLTDGQTITFGDVGNANIQTLTEDGEVTVTWTANSKGDRFIKFSIALDSCNIVIKSISRSYIPPITYLAEYITVPRWRGFDSPFGDIWTNIDGVIADTNPSHSSTVHIYTCNDPELFSDELGPLYKKIGEEPYNLNNYIKEFGLGSSANIYPRAIGGSLTTFKCDYRYIGRVSDDNYIHTLFVGGAANGGGFCGFGYWSSYSGVSRVHSRGGFRSAVRPLSL